MSDHWDEFSKSLIEKSVPRRETLRLLGAALAGALLGPLGMKSAWASARDPCKTFCRCRDKSQQNACLAACSACGKNTNRLCGTCGAGYVCCAEPGPYEFGACVDGQCTYWCVEGAVDCGGFCTSLADDPYNCGACGNVCPASAPYCDVGTCRCPGTVCDGVCVDVLSDPANCGGCGQACLAGFVCASGVCMDPLSVPQTDW